MIDVHVARLRRKVDDQFPEKLVAYGARRRICCPPGAELIALLRRVHAHAVDDVIRVRLLDFGILGEMLLQNPDSFGFATKINPRRSSRLMAVTSLNSRATLRFLGSEKSMILIDCGAEAVAGAGSLETNAAVPATILKPLSFPFAPKATSASTAGWLIRLTSISVALPLFACSA